MRNKILSLIPLIVLIPFVSTAQQVPVLSEIMFRPSTANSEFIELYNPYDEPINILNYQIGYSTSSPDGIVSVSGSAVIEAKSFAVILEEDYDFINGPYDFPENINLFVLDDRAFGSSGMANTSDRPIYLIDGYGATVSTYTYSADNSDGISDEKIILNDDNSSFNWSNSTLINGTPGLKNSASPKEFDLTISSTTLQPVNPFAEDNVYLDIIIINRGTESSGYFKLNVFIDQDLNNIPEENELTDTGSFEDLSSGDSVIFKSSLGSFEKGNYNVIAVIDFGIDELPGNNSSNLEFTVLENPADYNDIVVNEIMYAPSSGEPEWIELFNRSDENILLTNWIIGDASSVKTITTDSVYINSGEFLILADDPGIHDYYIISSPLIIFDLPSLNNNGDDIKLFDIYNRTIDSVKYLPSWGGTGGSSLERKFSDVESNDPINWGSSLNPRNGTPGFQNSLTPKDYDVMLASLTYKPEITIAMDKIDIYIQLTNSGLKSTGSLMVALYLDINLDSTAQSNELKNLFQVSNLQPGQSRELRYTLPGLTPGIYNLIAAIQFPLDEDNSNDTLIERLNVAPEPLPFNSVVINEIMYDPLDDEPEWVELYNRTNNQVYIKSWYFSDSNSKIQLTSEELMIDPKSYLVLAENDIINKYYSITSKILYVNLPPLNNGGDLIAIYDSLNIVMDSVIYSSSWSNEYKKSLERKSPFGESNEPGNWGSSISGSRATPGQENSLAPKDFDLSFDTFRAERGFKFVNNDIGFGFDIVNRGIRPAESFSVNFYDDKNNDGRFSPIENIITVENLSLPSGDTLKREFYYTFEKEGMHNLLGIINFTPDEFNSNDSSFINVEVVNPIVNRNDIIINEIMYAPNSPYPEWIEFFNRSDNAVAVTGFNIADSRDTTTIDDSVKVLVQPHGFLVIARDSIISELYDIPSPLLITSFPSLNNSGDQVLILDNYQRTIDSVKYDPDWGGTAGYSLERRDTEGESNDPANWSDSRNALNGTPGKINSIIPKQFDLAINNLSYRFTHQNDKAHIDIDAVIKNNGLSRAEKFSLFVYLDIDRDSAAETGELLSSTDIYDLAAGDSLLVTLPGQTIAPGKYNLIADLLFEADEITDNNKIIISLSIPEPSLPFNSIVINEIMYSPANDEPEWFELLNISNVSVNLKNWRFMDVSSEVQLTGSDFNIEPGSFLVVTEDSSIIYHHNITSKILIANLPSLNNNGDRMVLLDSLNTVIDSLTYSSGWGGKNGRSLEKLNPFLNGNDSSSWRESIDPDKATPGKENSVRPKNYDVAITDFSANSVNVFMNDSVNFSVTAANAGESYINGILLNIYYDKNKDTRFSENEIIKTFNDLELQPGDTLYTEFDYSFDSPGNKLLRAETVFRQDEYLLNNIIDVFVNILPVPINKYDIVINEIMYAPNSPSPEWIEFFNRSEKAVNLMNYRIADDKDSSTFASNESFIYPGDFLVLSKDSIIYELHDIPSPLIVSSFPTLNNSGDRIILLDNYDRVIDSLFYYSGWGGNEGRSLERINTDAPSISQSNWGTSIDPLSATPGRINSLVPKNYDVKIISAGTVPPHPNAGDTVIINTVIANNGLMNADITLKLYSDENGDRLPDELLELYPVNDFVHGTTLNIFFDYHINNLMRRHDFVIEAEFELDENYENNFYYLSVFPSSSIGGIIINEIMFDPVNGEPEWFELYNGSANAINLTGWKVSDLISSPQQSVITQSNKFIGPDEYLIIAKDSSFFAFHTASSQIIINSFASLNNGADALILIDPNSFTADSIFYDDNFNTKKGYSLERITPTGSSASPLNWRHSAAIGGTPGSINSSTPKDFDAAVAGIMLSPQFPELGEEINISVKIKNRGRLEAEHVILNLTSEKLGLMESTELDKIASNDSIILFTQQRFVMPGYLRITAEIKSKFDQDTSNNKLEKVFYSGFSQSTLLINEVMYDPPDSGTEWIEVVNVSQSEVNIKGWLIAEKSSKAKPKILTGKNTILNPGELFIIADDTSGFISKPDKNILEADFGELNSTEDEIILYDFRGALIDSLFYTNVQGGGDGISIERISLELPTNDPYNWTASLALSGSSPGLLNSVLDVKPVEKSHVVINEIMFDPADHNCEFIEFINTTDNFIETGNWKIEDRAGNKMTISNTPTTLPPNSLFVVSADSSVLFNYTWLKEFERLNIVNNDLHLNNGEDLIILYDAFGNCIDSLTYSTQWHNQKIISTADKSLERINPFIDTNDPHNWSTSAAEYSATPGRINSVYTAITGTKNKIFIAPNPFSPDGDAFEDFTIVNYNLDKSAAQVRIQVFDSKGRKVRTLVNNQFLGSEGSIIFDGLDESGNPLKIGIYILLIELLDSYSGALDILKEVVVIARKL